ncbi:protein Wnt-1-like isoform X1 [Anneissia japonica]|uniref:protein Wnt-1-like isoform X1 n=1 Tax=Anneissia japonica TaxID=1529436 RepID=UPI001425B0D5|nr:protein Wnt-1-like isoform X1 [Anneissia japonica]
MMASNKPVLLFVIIFSLGFFDIQQSTLKAYAEPPNTIAHYNSPETVKFCRQHSWLNERQRRLCLLHPDLIPSVLEGAISAIMECKRQFKMERWNCPANNITAVFGSTKLSMKNKEIGYLQAITSAGIMYDITKACGSGELMECSCDNRKRQAGSNFTWGGCSDNIRYGEYFAKDFIDASEEGQTASSLMTLHNYEAGRQAIKKNMGLRCKCHGVSATCTSRICWNSMPKLPNIGSILKEQYAKAPHVKYSSKRRKLRPIKKGYKKPTTEDIVYLKESPSYCEENKRHGSSGTHGRYCNQTSLGIDGCKLLCCDRGYQTMVQKVQESCHCRFLWCCKVECETCEREQELHICN